ncbi:MAG TPA: FkbM family methyltransferase [Bacteroidales bacterium]|nr:FkbM family methyltransferase [Bacteroidales bacterium]HSA44337.1 FkbM family methyltransferase [Bacteroidales bacterium]
MKRILRPGSCCIDVGCHKGEILDVILKLSPEGNHWAFEPIPEFCRQLEKKYTGRAVHIMPFALSDEKQTVSFQHVLNAPAYSGLKKRKYDIKNPLIQEITVEAVPLDQILNQAVKIDFMKIDVEGAEYAVIRGAKEMIARDKPVIIFEFGTGAADCYGVNARMMYELLGANGLQISLLKNYLRNEPSLSLQALEDCFSSGREYYFIAHP